MAAVPITQVILEGVRDALKAGATDAGLNVFLDRSDRLTRGELPALLVQEAPEGETVDPKTVDGLEERTYAVLITCVIADPDAEDAAKRGRALGLQVEQLIGVPTFAVPKHNRARIAGSRIFLGSEGEVPMAGREQLWRFTYYTRRGAPEQAR
jgi:hypothetical protein